jgi:hypothetical protein
MRYVVEEHVVIEFAALGKVEGGRYWKLELPNKAIYSPSESEREWLEKFLRVPKDSL